MKNHLTEILLALADARVDFVVAGGVAAVLHGVERVTMDLDLAVDLRPENVQAFLRVMRPRSRRWFGKKGRWCFRSSTSTIPCGTWTFF